MLNLLPTGEGEIIKRTKYGFYVKFPTENKPIFIQYNETLNESIFLEKKMIDFISADTFEKIYVNPESYCYIKRYNKIGAPMGEYSTIVMKNNDEVNVIGLPTSVAEKIRAALKELLGE
jgi:hypothetical protein